ncbi:SGNH/GDSL hydrolase family protein [Acinetobacter cumulans]|uniref:SGNH/GDSL hydrolase family protein n=1 Tax=Acinetobacter cumulans TaxID=2136182 RepID=UPI00207B7C2C|nr:SGNH/GDSL hydrolase family protein [Acinetobacter cumulans]
MSNIQGQKKWSDVRLLETHELARGGVNGNLNEQAKALADRTELLMEEKASKSEIVQGVFEFGTYSEFNAARATLPLNCTVVINEENTSGTGTWGVGNNRWNGSELKKSENDPLIKSKEYADKTKAPLENFNAGGNPDNLIELTDVLDRFVAAWNLKAEYVGKLLTDGILKSVEQPDGSFALCIGNGTEVNLYGSTFTLDFSNPDVAFQVLSSDNKTIFSVPIGGADLDRLSELDKLLTSQQQLSRSIRTDGIVNSETFGANFLTEMRSKLAAIRSGEIEQFVFTSIGNSWTDTNIYFTKYLVRALKAKYGNAGAGFGTVSRHFADSDEATMHLTGSWVTTNGATAGNVNAEGLAIIKSESSNAGDYVQCQLNTQPSKATRLKLFAKANGAVVEYSSNGVVISQITLNSTVTELNVDLDNSRSSTQYARFKVISGTFIFFGIELSNADKGIRFNKCGAGASSWARWLATESAQWVEQMTALKSDTVLMLEGVNGSYSYNAETEAAHTLSMMNRVKAATPTTDFLLISPPDTLDTGRSNSLVDFAYRLRQLAFDQSIAHLDLTKVFGTALQAKAKGYYGTDTNHPTTKGGKLIASSILNLMNT